MKKIVFAHTAFVIDFTTKKEAEEYAREAKYKGYFVWNEPHEIDDGKWSLEVYKPYKKYNPGW